MTTSTPKTLVRHLRDLVSRSAEVRASPLPLTTEERIASGVIANPQAHIDALVEAGVLKQITTDHYGNFNGPGRPCYAIVQPKPPHVHDWRISGETLVQERTYAKRQGWVITTEVDIGPAHWAMLPLKCTCGEVKWVVNKLPIEVPD